MGAVDGGSVSDGGVRRRVPRGVKIAGMVLLAIVIVLGGLLLFARSTAEAAKAPVVEMAEPVLEGTWELDSASRDGEACLEQELEVVRSLHMSRYLTLKSDGKAVLEMLGATLKGTWESSSKSRARMDMALSELDDLGLADVWELRLDGQDLVVSGNGWVLRMFRIDAADKQDENFDMSDLGSIYHLLQRDR